MFPALISILALHYKASKLLSRKWFGAGWLLSRLYNICCYTEMVWTFLGYSETSTVRQSLDLKKNGLNSKGGLII